VLAVADPCIISSIVDAVILVIRLTKDTRPQTIQAKEMLDEAGAPLLGTVINACDSNAPGFGSYTYGGYPQGYGSYGSSLANGSEMRECVSRIGSADRRS
jgi:Mrp family chromosome partitioning ATPase